MSRISTQARADQIAVDNRATCVSQATDAAEESVEELAGAGQDYEAQILKGVEDATNHREEPVPNHGDQKPRRSPGDPGRL